MKQYDIEREAELINRTKAEIARSERMLANGELKKVSGQTKFGKVTFLVKGK